MRTYKGSRKSVFLLGSIDDLEGQLDQSARMHVRKNDIAKSCMDERFEMAFFGTCGYVLEAGLFWGCNLRKVTHCLHRQKGVRLLREQHAEAAHHGALLRWDH
jgi:hypothetical protein